MLTPSKEAPPLNNVDPAHTRLGIITGLMAPAMMMGVYISMFSVAIPAIRTDFSLQADVAAWVSTIYTLPFMMFMPLYGRMGDALGKRRLFMMGIMVFMVGTAITTLASGLGWLMVGRAIQGFGTAGFVPLSMAIITQLFPADERGKIMGTWNSALPLTGIIGPFLGGLLIDYLGWRAIFWPVLLVGLLTFLIVRKKVPPLAGFAQPDFLRRFDWGGVILLGGTITSLLFYASSRPVTGVAPLRDWRLLAAVLILLGAFIRWEKRQANPFVPLQLYAHKTFTLTSLCAGIRMFTMNSIRFLIPLYLVDVYGLSAAATGIVLTAHAIPLFLILRLGGQLADRWGSRWPVVISLSVQTGAMVYLALLPAQSAVWMVVIGVLGQSTGAAISLAPLHRASMMGISEEQTGVAAGLYSMVRFAGSVFGTALSGVILQYSLNQALPVAEAYQAGFWFVAGVTLLGAILGAQLKV